MKKHHWLILVLSILLSLSLMTSCDGDKKDNGNGKDATEEQQSNNAAQSQDSTSSADNGEANGSEASEDASTKENTSSEVDISAEDIIVPNWAEMAIQVKLTDLLEYEIFQQAFNDMDNRDMKELKNALDKMGIDPFEDIEYFNLFLAGLSPELENNPQLIDYLALISIDYEKQRMQDFLNSSLDEENVDFLQTTQSGFPVFIITEDDATVSIILMDNLIAFCKGGNEEDAIEIAQGQGNIIPTNDPMYLAIAELKSRYSSGYFIYKPTQEVKTFIKTMAENDKQLQQFAKNFVNEIENVDYIKAGGNAKGGIEVLFGFQMTSNASAQNMTTQFNGLKSMGTMFLGSPDTQPKVENPTPEQEMMKIASEIVNQLTIETRGNTSVIGISITKEQLENISNMAMENM